jgi:hypothetical protein
MPTYALRYLTFINLSKHGIDFEDTIEVFYGPIILRRSDRNNEARWIAIGYSENRLFGKSTDRRSLYAASRPRPDYLSAPRKKK